MSSLPPPDQMAAVVSGVTQTMLGITFTPCAATPWNDLVWRAAVLPIPGARPLMVGLSSDQPGCTTLGARMFSVAENEVSDDMLSDSLCELVNMTAGILKTQLRLDQPLGLPKIAPAGQPPVPAPPQPAASLVLRAREKVGLVLWVFEGIVQE